MTAGCAELALEFAIIKQRPRAKPHANRNLPASVI
jgi:hypothetical protein